MKSLFTCGLIAVLSIPAVAFGKSSKNFSLGYDDLWGALIRYIRIDLDNQLVERDKEAGYVIFMFRYSDKSKEIRSTLELIKRKEAKGNELVTVQLDIPNTPAMMEKYFISGLEKKIKAEFPKKL